MDIEFLKFLNNGYDPRLLYGTGGLGYRPERNITGRGKTITQTTTEEKQKKSYPTYYMTLVNPPEEEEKEVIMEEEIESPKEVEEEIEKIKEDIEEETEEIIEDKINRLEELIKNRQEVKENLIKENEADVGGYGYEVFRDILEEEDELIDNLEKLKDSFVRKKKQFIQLIPRKTTMSTMKVVKQHNKKTTMSTSKVHKSTPERKEMYSKTKLQKITKKNIKKKYDYPKNLLKQIKKVELDLDKYETTNPPVVFTDEERDDYTNEINIIIDFIESVRYEFFKPDEIDDDDDFKEQKAIRLSLYNKIKGVVVNTKNPYYIKALPYLKSILVDEEHKFFDVDIDENDEEIFVDKMVQTSEKNKKLIKAALKAFFSPGKPAEFGICGPDNPIAQIIYRLTNPNFEITDYIAEDAGSSLGGQFPIDNVDRINLIFSEMKYYTSITFRNALKLQVRLKKKYYNELLQILKDLFEDYLTALDDDNITETNKIMTDIEIALEVLTNKDNFNKNFYKYSKGGYIGLGVTMNKFNPIKIPKGYDFENSPSTKEQIEVVQSKQGQKFIPNIKNRKVVGMTTSAGENKDVDEAIKESFFDEGQEYSYYITCAGGDAIGVYDYTNDDYVEDDFILGVYRTAFAHDDRDGTDYNAVLIPIEKFELPKIPKKESPTPKKKTKKQGKKKPKRDEEDFL